MKRRDRNVYPWVKHKKIFYRIIQNHFEKMVCTLLNNYFFIQNYILNHPKFSGQNLGNSNDCN